jgi:hypothetical protein
VPHRKMLERLPVMDISHHQDRRPGEQSWNNAKLHQQVANRGRVQDACVVKDDGDHGSVAHAELLAQRREFIERRLTPGQEFPLVTENVFQPHAPVRPDLSTRD